MLGADGKLLRNGNRLVLASGPCCCDDTDGGGDTGGMDDCDRRLFVIWESEPVNGDPVIQQGPSTVFMHTTTIEQDGVSVEVTINAELIGLEECISHEFNDDITFVIRSTLVSNPPHSDQNILGNVNINTQTGNAETATASATASSVNDYFGRVFVRFEHPDLNFSPRVFAVEWVYVDT